ncbi:MAG: cupin domain-containing protein [Flexilinea sp.]|nr:cupin domain-containing protein [Flexilinea sp.]
MKEKTGEVFSIAEDNAPVPGCTISKEVYNGENPVIYFSLAKNSDISAEIHPYCKMLIAADGILEVYGQDGYLKKMNAGDMILIPAGFQVGMKTAEGAVYTEISVKKEGLFMNEAVKPGEVFNLAELVPYIEGKIVNMDVVHNDKMKFVVMAFDEGTGLSEHAAPGEAIIFALDGEAVIGYEGKEHSIKAGENFHFAKEGLHSVKASKRFKMALLLTLE